MMYFLEMFHTFNFFSADPKYKEIIMKSMQQEEPVECELCREAVGKLLSHLGNTWTDHTIALFDGHLCHHADDPLMCIEQANIWWPYIAKIIYNPDAAKYECYDLSYGVCEVTK